MIYEYLPIGSKNAIPSRELCRMLNIDKRTLAAAVERERRQGKPICANYGGNPGYYLAANKEEMENYCKALFHRAGELHKTRKACMKSIPKLPAPPAPPAQ